MCTEMNLVRQMIKEIWMYSTLQRVLNCCSAHKERTIWPLLESVVPTHVSSMDPLRKSNITNHVSSWKWRIWSYAFSKFQTKFDNFWASKNKILNNVHLMDSAIFPSWRVGKLNLNFSNFKQPRCFRDIFSTGMHLIGRTRFWELSSRCDATCRFKLVHQNRSIAYAEYKARIHWALIYKIREDIND